MKKGKSLFSAIIFVLLFTVGGIAQQTTTVVIRAQAKDAKFIGTSMGGALIMIENAKTGELLAKGLTEGSTGDTKKLVTDPKARYEQISTEGSARFVAHLALTKPVFVTVSATGPMNNEQSRVTSSTQLWLIPGKDITGDGIILEVPGFAINILQAQVHNDSLTVTAHTVMMCGCPIEPGGLWDSNEMEFIALLLKDGKKVAQKEMTFTGKTSTFEASFLPEVNGDYQIMVYGYDARTGNTGVDKARVTVNSDQ